LFGEYLRVFGLGLLRGRDLALETVNILLADPRGFGLFLSLRVLVGDADAAGGEYEKDQYPTYPMRLVVLPVLKDDGAEGDKAGKDDGSVRQKAVE
jgi:hypothetical protein